MFVLIMASKKIALFVADRKTAIILSNEGFTISQIPEALKRSSSTISSFLNRFQKDGSIKSNRLNGIRRILTKRCDTRFKRLYNIN